MKNAVEKWERLGVAPPRDELQVAAVGLSAARSAAPERTTVNQAVGQAVTADPLMSSPVEAPPIIAAETEAQKPEIQKHFRVEAAHTTAPSVERSEETSSPAVPGSAKPSQLSQRMQRVQETCARLLPIKGRSSKEETTSTAGWVMKLLFHPEAVVVLLLIVACFLAIVILDPGEPEEAELAVAPPAEQKAPEATTPALEAPVAESMLPAVQAAPVVPQPAASPVAEATPDSAVGTPVAEVPVVEAPLAEAPVVSEPVAQSPPPSSATPVAPPAGEAVPQVAQAMPPVAQPQSPAPSTAELTVTEAVTPPVQNPTVVTISPHANTYPITPTPQGQQNVSVAPQASMPPQAATNMPAVIGGQNAAAEQASVWPQSGAPMFEGPPSSAGTMNVALGHPQPKRILNHTYTPGAPATSMPTASPSAYPPTVSPELYWQPQHVAQRPPQPRTNPGAAQLQGIIQQPQSGNLHEHY